MDNHTTHVSNEIIQQWIVDTSNCSLEEFEQMLDDILIQMEFLQCSTSEILALILQLKLNFLNIISGQK